jgi:cytoskeleton protein RodZ
MTDSPALGFGEELRRERQIREISLEEISSATKISVRLLTALERSDVSRLPAPAFTRGFIRAYAVHLGIDPEEKVNAYLADLAGEPIEATAPKKAQPRSRFWRGRRGAASAIVAFVAGVLVVLGFFASPERRERNSKPSVVAPRAIPVAFKNVGVSNEPTPVIQNAMASVVPPPVSGGGISMTLQFDEDSWAKIDADGRTVLSGLVRRGEIRQLQARDGFRITLGNAGGVRVSVDGHVLEPLGAAGEVVRDLALPASSARG